MYLCVCGKRYPQCVCVQVYQHEFIIACVHLCKREKVTDIQEDLKTNSCIGSRPSMTSVDKRLCVGISGAGDSSALQAGGEAFQWSGESVETSKSQRAGSSGYALQDQ